MRIFILRFAAVPLALAAAACATRPDPGSAPESGSAASGGACTWPAGHFLLVGGGFEAIEVKAGEPMPLTLSTVAGRFSPPEALPRSCRAVWSVEPAGAATIDATGLLTVPAGTPIGTEMIVAAVVNGERARGTVRVADPNPSPIVGRWSQAGPAACGGAPVEADSLGIRELEIRPTGAFSVTWIPFETYKDYWGSYTFDRATGRLAFKVDGGNRIPEGMDLDGTAAVEDGRLVLRDIWLGSRGGATGGTDCTVTFGR